MIRSIVLLPVAPLVAGWLLYLQRRRGWSWARVFFVSLFATYALVVVGVALFPIPVEHVFRPQFGEVPFLHWVEWRPFTISFQPTIMRIQTVPNVVLGMPFGFGAWFVLADPTWRKVLGVGTAAAAGIEVLQLIIGLALVGYPYRVTDVSDFIFNVSGVVIGIGAFYGFAWAWRILDRGTGGAGVIGHIRAVVG